MLCVGHSSGALRRSAPAWKTFVEISRWLRTRNCLQRQPLRQLTAPPCYRIRHQRHAFSSRSPMRSDTFASHAAMLQAFEKSSKASVNLELKSLIRLVEFPKATHDIRELAELGPGVPVTLYGYLGSRSDLSKKLSFVQLLSSDLSHAVQLVSARDDRNGKNNPHHAELKSFRAQVPVVITGRTQTRQPPKDDRDDIARIKHIEVLLESVQPLNGVPDNVILKDETNFPAELRHLQIKTNKTIRRGLRMRQNIAQLCRDVLINKLNFLEVETPLLFKSTPEGAREFIIPSRTKGSAYALPQSPQQYKQILMASGIPRYFQIARCFRDEDLRADRQPEFTQLDLEMAFSTAEDVMLVTEELLKVIWNTIDQSLDRNDKFPRMTYKEAMLQFGSDKPDLRLGIKIEQLPTRFLRLLSPDMSRKITPRSNSIVEAMKMRVSNSATETRRFVSTFMNSPAALSFFPDEYHPTFHVIDYQDEMHGLSDCGSELMQYLECQMVFCEGDLLVLKAREDLPFTGGSTPMGELRLALHKAAVAQGYISAPSGYSFLWVTDFPLFTQSKKDEPGQGGQAGISSTHHPFTAPKTPADLRLLSHDPLGVTADHYDIVVNGVELGGGSRRIHDAKVQEYVLRDVLKMSEERLSDFAHLLEALRSGCPPHAGIALGFDRLIAVLIGADSVRDVIAFPKSGKGEDLMVKSPSILTEEQLKTYHLQLRDE